MNDAGIVRNRLKIESSINNAKRFLEIQGRFGAARVVLLPASAGTGIIAGAAVRAVAELAGVTDILTKSLGSNNPVNLVKAAMDGFLRLRNVEEIEHVNTSGTLVVTPSAMSKLAVPRQMLVSAAS